MLGHAGRMVILTLTELNLAKNPLLTTLTLVLGLVTLNPICLVLDTLVHPFSHLPILVVVNTQQTLSIHLT